MRPACSFTVRRSVPLLCIGFALCFATRSAAANGPAVGTEFGVNTYATGSQAWSSVAMLPDGDFVIVWQSDGSYGTDTDGRSVQGQRFDANGSPLGPEFQVNIYTTSSQGNPHAAYGADGSFVVVWDSDGSSGTDTDGHSIQGRRFAADGSPVGSEFQVNSYTTQGQSKPEVAVGPGGAFVVTWGNDSGGSPGNDTLAGSIVARRFAADATPLAPDFQVNTYTPNTQADAGIAMAADGTFLIVWDSDGSAGGDTSNRSVQGQLFDADGMPSGSEMQLNSYTTNSQADPHLAMLPTGEFIVVWASSGSPGTDDSGSSSQARIFDAAGTPAGPEFQVNTYTFASQDRPSVSADPGGDFVVTWWSSFSDDSDMDGSSIHAQRFELDGTPIAAEFEVNTDPTGDQTEPRTAMSSVGHFVIVWQSEGAINGTSEYNIKGQRFGTRIFSDGFESGDTSAWSAIVP